MKSLLCLTTILFASLAAAGQTDSFTVEADSFISGLAPDNQISQAAAIRLAINGESKALDSIRAMRNREPKLPGGVTATDVAPGLRLYSADSISTADGALPLLVYLHGGGWTIGSINSCAEFCAALAARGDIKVLAADYPLAPEHPFPEGLDFCTTAVTTARSNAREWGIDPCRISVGGDSSGGNLALAASLSLLKAGEAPPSSIVLFYPVVKAWNDGSRSWKQFSVGFALDGEYMEAFNEAYLSGGADARDPLVSPAAADDRLLSQLPPVMMIAAERDILCDSGREFARRLQQCGVPVTREQLPGTVHLFITVPGQPTARTHAITRTRLFILQH